MLHINMRSFHGIRSSFRMPYDSYMLSLSPIAWWKLDEPSGTTIADYGPNNLEGTVLSVTVGSDEIAGIGSASILDANSGSIRTIASGLSVPVDFQTIGNADPFTVSAWFKTSDAGTDSSEWRTSNTIVDFRKLTSSPNYRIPFCIGTLSNKLCFGHSSSGSAGQKVSSASSVCDGAWHFGVMVVGDTTVDFYIDGVFDVQRTIASVDNSVGVTSTANLRVGARATNAGSTTDYFNGNIGQVAIFNRALSVEEIANIYAYYSG